MQRFCKPQSSAQARKEAPIFNGVCSITGLMSQIVSLADTGSNPAVHPKFIMASSSTNVIGFWILNPENSV